MSTGPLFKALRHLLFDNRGFAGFHEDRSLLLVLRHFRVLIVALPEATAQDLDACVMHLLPAMKTTTLTHGTDAAWAHVMDVMEEHLIPAVPTAQAEGHERMQSGPSAIGVRCQKIIPKVRMVEIRDEHPSGRESHTTWEVGPQHEAPAFAEGQAQSFRAEKPNRTPKAEKEEHVLDAIGEPLLVHALVTLSTRASIWESAPPEQGEQATGIAGTQEMPEGDDGYCEPAIPRKGPLLRNVQPLCWVPAELTVIQEIESGIVVPVVLHDNVHPG